MKEKGGKREDQLKKNVFGHAVVKPKSLCVGQNNIQENIKISNDIGNGRAG